MKTVLHQLYGAGSILETKNLSAGGQMLYVKFETITLWINPSSPWIL